MKSQDLQSPPLLTAQGFSPYKSARGKMSAIFIAYLSLPVSRSYCRLSNSGLPWCVSMVAWAYLVFFRIPPDIEVVCACVIKARGILIGELPDLETSCVRDKMYIKQIVLEGFKSYAQRTEVAGFDPLFNAITGLNGSGKSNILDAICFLLGITNLSQVHTHVLATCTHARYL